jgi:glycosyltransferase involved in cell wall biosynthesis
MEISVFITSFNQKHYLTEAINSVLEQTLRPQQIIIVDDCSSDGTQELIAGFHSKYPHLITPIYHSQNTGVAQVRIDALNVVTGDYVTYVDGDDRFLPRKLEKEFGLLQSNPHAQIAFSNNFYMTEDGIYEGVWAEEILPPQGDVFCQTFARDFPKRNLFRMELVNYHAWKQVGFHDPFLHIYEDFDMRIRLAKHLKTVYYDEPLSEIRLHSHGLSRSKFFQHFEALNYIFLKNRPLLSDLSNTEKNYVFQRFAEWMTPISKYAIEEALKEGRRIQALRLLLATRRYDPTVFNWSEMVKVFLPRKFARRLLPFGETRGSQST